MKSIISVIVLCLISLNLVGQVTLPFNEDFEDEQIIHENSSLQVASSQCSHYWSTDPYTGNKITCNTNYSDHLINARGHSWDIGNFNNQSHKSLKLTINGNDHPWEAINDRTRSEYMVNTLAAVDQTYYYSWRFFIPDNMEYTEEDLGWLMIGQLHSGNKIFSIQYVDDTNLPSNSGRRLFIMIYNPNELLHSRVNITNAIKKGVWNELIFKVKWAKRDKFQSPNDYGYFSLWLNKNPITSATMELGNDGVRNYNSHISDIGINPSAIPYEFSFPGIEHNKSERTLGVKIGHYRSNRSHVNSIYYDDLQITNIFPNNRTKLKNEYCNINLPIEFWKTTLEAYEIIGATEYVAEFELNGMKNYTGMGNSPMINLNYVNFLVPGKTYNVKIRAKGVQNSGYGESCSIYIPSRTRLMDQFCNISIPYSQKNQTTLQAYEIRGATEYVAEFELNGMRNYVGMGNSPIINLEYVNFLIPGKTYNVKIRAKGVFDSGYGDSCEIYFQPSIFEYEKQNHSTLTLDENEILIYPNPVSDVINVQSDVKKNKLILYNYTGKILIEQIFISTTSINFSELQNGIYFISILNENRSQTIRKVIKK